MGTQNTVWPNETKLLLHYTPPRGVTMRTHTSEFRNQWKCLNLQTLTITVLLFQAFFVRFLTLPSLRLSKNLSFRIFR